MFKRLRWVGCAALCLIAAQVACAAVNVNTATADALTGIKGIGPAKAQAIIKERAAHGPYKNADDLAKRVKGLGAKSVAKLQEEGLTIGTAPSSSAKTASGKPAQAAVQERR